MKKLFFLVLGIVVSVGCFAWSLQGTNMDQLKAGFAGANYWSLPIMLLLLFAFYWLKTMRWQWLLAPVAPLTLKQLFPPMLIGFAIAGKITDAYKIADKVFDYKMIWLIPSAIAAAVFLLFAIFFKEEKKQYVY